MNARTVIEAETPKRVFQRIERITDDDLSTALEMSGFENAGARWIYGRYAPGKRYLYVTRHAKWKGSGVLRQDIEDPEPERAEPNDTWKVKVLKQPRGVYANWPVVAQHGPMRSEEVPGVLAQYGIELKRWLRPQEAETPKGTFQKAQPAYKIHHPPGTTEWRCPGCGQLVITNGEEPSPKRWSDGHVCRNWVKVQVNEAEDPKRIFKQLPNTKIWPGRNYWLNIATADEPWEEGEFCPTEIGDDNAMNTLDGLYGLSDLVARAVRYNGNMNDPREAQYEQGMDQYEDPMWDAVRRGVTSGTVDGVAGPLKWRLVYHPPGHSWEYGEHVGWNAANVVQVEPGKEYPSAEEPG